MSSTAPLKKAADLLSKGVVRWIGKGKCFEVACEARKRCHHPTSWTREKVHNPALARKNDGLQPREGKVARSTVIQTIKKGEKKMAIPRKCGRLNVPGRLNRQQLGRTITVKKLQKRTNTQGKIPRAYRNHLQHKKKPTTRKQRKPVQRNGVRASENFY